MLIRTSVLAALAAAAAVAASASPATVALVDAAGHETGLAHSAPQAHSQNDAENTEADVTVTPTALPTCPADVKNHGEYVSSVAKANHGHSGDHGKPEATDDTHGALVSAAAQSDCGKPEGAEAGEDADDADESAAPDASHGKSGQSHGKSGEHVPDQEHAST